MRLNKGEKIEVRKRDMIDGSTAYQLWVGGKFAGHISKKDFDKLKDYLVK